MPEKNTLNESQKRLTSRIYQQKQPFSNLRKTGFNYFRQPAMDQTGGQMKSVSILPNLNYSSAHHPNKPN